MQEEKRDQTKFERDVRCVLDASTEGYLAKKAVDYSALRHKLDLKDDEAFARVLREAIQRRRAHTRREWQALKHDLDVLANSRLCARPFFCDA